MTYARARLWLGMSAVGTWVLLCATILLLDLPGRFPPAWQTWPIAGSVWGIVLAYWLISLPFDWLGGYYLPRKHGRQVPAGGRWWLRWLRATGVQGLLYGLFGMALVGSHHWLGDWGAVGLMAIFMLLLAGLQLYIARALVAWEPFFDNHKGKLLVFLENEDPGFTGGISGVPGSEVFVLPRQWQRQFPEKMLKLLIARRHGAVQTLAHARGFLVAIFWNLALFALAVWLSPRGIADLAGLLYVMAWYTLFSFVGLLGLLPALSRRAVWEIDRWVYYRGGDADLLRRSFVETDKLQDEEPERPPLVEFIFHPLPSVSSRNEHLAKQSQTKGAWHSARQSLYFSWAGLGLLARAVHCNVGFPERWVFLPGD